LRYAPSFSVNWLFTRTAEKHGRLGIAIFFRLPIRIVPGFFSTYKPVFLQEEKGNKKTRPSRTSLCRKVLPVKAAAGLW